MSLVGQARLLADLVEDAESVCDGRTKLDSRLPIEDGANVHLHSLPGPSDEDRRTQALQVYLGQIAKELSDQDGTNFAQLGREAVVKLLEDPLSSETRVSRRNLLAASALALLLGFTGKKPTRVPGLDIDLSDQGAVTVVFILGLVVYQAVAFGVYLRTDIVKRRVIRSEVDHRLSTLQSAVTSVAARKHVFGAGGFQQAILSKWIEYANHECELFRAEVGTIRWRQNWDVWVPAGIAGIAALLLVWQLFEPLVRTVMP